MTVNNLLLLLAILAFVIAAVLLWPAHGLAAIAIGSALFAAAHFGPLP